LIVVIGASGFIGKHLVSGALPADEPVRCLARDAGVLADVSANVEVIEGDMRDEAQIDRVLEPGATVINLAFDRTAPPADNLAAARVLARGCERARIARLLHLSTAVVVGANRDESIDEASRCEPVTPYESTKLAIEDVLRSEIENTELVIARPTAVFGAGGQNLVKLARETAGAGTLQRYLRACLQARRPMNLVSVETVCAAIVHLARRRDTYEREVFIVAEDDARSNNYRDVERALMAAFGRADYRWAPVRVPPVLERGVRRLAGRSGAASRRRYRADKLLGTGFVKPLGFDEALRRYAAYLAHQFQRDGEVRG
jgi:nucleoside-diphosphate-sugar epimerase